MNNKEETFGLLWKYCTSNNRVRHLFIIIKIKTYQYLKNNINKNLYGIRKNKKSKFKKSLEK